MYKIAKDNFLIKFCKQKSSKDSKNYNVQCNYKEKELRFCFFLCDFFPCDLFFFANFFSL